MATDHRRVNRELVQDVLLDDPGLLKEIIERVLQQILEAEITEHIAAAPFERADSRTGHRNGYKPRTFRTKVGTLNRLVSQDRERIFSTRLFSRYHESSKIQGHLSLPNVMRGLSASWDDPGSGEVPRASLLREVLQHRPQLVLALVAGDELCKVSSPLLLASGGQMGVPRLRQPVYGLVVVVRPAFVHDLLGQPAAGLDDPARVRLDGRVRYLSDQGSGRFAFDRSDCLPDKVFVQEDLHLARG